MGQYRSNLLFRGLQGALRLLLLGSSTKKMEVGMGEMQRGEI